MSYEKHYRQADDAAISLDTVSDHVVVEMQFHSIPKPVTSELFLIPMSDLHLQDGIENVPIFEIRWGNNPEDRIRINLESALALILMPDDEAPENTENYPLLQHAILESVRRELIDVKTLGRTLVRSLINGKISTTGIGEVLLSKLTCFYDHPAVRSRSEAYMQWIGPPESGTFEPSNTGSDVDDDDYDSDYDDTEYWDPNTGELRTDLLG
jgi:hypothetical protein